MVPEIRGAMRFYFVMQEKGDIDLAIRYYLTAIQVCLFIFSQL
jgi:hypothetical protein